MRQKDQESETQRVSRRYRVDESYYQYMPKGASGEERRRIKGSAALESAQEALVNVHLSLGAIQSLLHVVQVSSVVLEDVCRLSRACEAVTEAISTTQSILSGRAKASARRQSSDVRK